MNIATSVDGRFGSTAIYHCSCISSTQAGKFLLTNHNYSRNDVVELWVWRSVNCSFIWNHVYVDKVIKFINLVVFLVCGLVFDCRFIWILTVVWLNWLLLFCRLKIVMTFLCRQCLYFAKIMCWTCSVVENSDSRKTMNQGMPFSYTSDALFGEHIRVWNVFHLERPDT